MPKKTLKIAMLYPNEMNIYGDYGNLEVLVYRAKQYGYDVEQVFYEPSDCFPENADIILGGGGQDSGQAKIIADLHRIAPKLKELAQKGTPMLMICGLYQLFGNYFETVNGAKLEGIGIFDLHTLGAKTRLVGNITVDWDGYKIIGYENHSGLTFLGENSTTKPFAKVIKGYGNNTDKLYEGARVHNVFGSYLHGPILAKNPKFTDELLAIAIQRKFNEQLSGEINDILIEKARKVAFSRP